MAKGKKKWQIFEENCVNYLNDNYSKYNVRFKGRGGSDSTVSDILVESSDGRPLFYIDCKMPKCQSGQFVVLPENGRLVFSSKNKSPLNKFSKQIIEYMNDNFDKYKDVNTKSISIDLSTSILEGWIKNHYKELSTKFVITCNLDNKFIIFPLDKLSTYFDISANYRIKGSGSRYLNKTDSSIVKSYLEKQFNKEFIEIYKDGKKCFAKFKTNNLTSNFKFSINDTKFQLSTSNAITKLSNTRNPNVIFSLKYNKIDDPNDLNIFINTLANL